MSSVPDTVHNDRERRLLDKIKLLKKENKKLVKVIKDGEKSFNEYMTKSKGIPHYSNE